MFTLRSLIIFIYTAMLHGGICDSSSYTETDSLDTLPPWQYCEIVKSIQSHFPLSLPNNSDTRSMRFIPEGEKSDSLHLDSIRILAWSVKARYNVRLNVDLNSLSLDSIKYELPKDTVGMTVVSYVDKALLWLNFTRIRPKEKGIALVIIERDTSQVSSNPEWRIWSRLRVKNDMYRSPVIPYAKQFYYPLDTLQILSTATQYLHRMKEDEFLYHVCDSTLCLYVTHSLHQTLRKRTWTNLFGTP